MTKTARQLDAEIATALASEPGDPRASATSEVGFGRYRDLPADEARGNPLHKWGNVHAGRLGSYWTVEVDVPLAELARLRPVLQAASRLKSVATERKAGRSLPPIELGVFRDGTAWIVDGNHRLIDARRARLPSVSVIFTFVGT